MKPKIGHALVVGGGISGIRSALDLAETGYGVTLIDKAPHLGGILSQLEHQFPTNHCGMCKMLPMVDRDAGSQYCLRKGLYHENIEIRTSTELAAIDGEPGNFTVILKEKPRFVNPELCIGCDACTPVCPVDVPDEYNAGLTSRKAIYLPVPHMLPNSYVIDPAACTRCGECVDVCPTQAIRLFQEGRKDFGVLVVDDEYTVRDSIKEWLDEEGFLTETAASGEEALELLTKGGFSMMLLDIKMPGMDGVEVLKKTKDIFPDMAVVMMTAYATVQTAVEAMKTGAMDYLMKPFDPEDLVSKVVDVYEAEEAAGGEQVQAGAVVFSGGTSPYDPLSGKNTFGYGVYPDVVTGIEFERMISGTGPAGQDGLRRANGDPVEKIAWIQCVGSRDLQNDADYCSGICCMYAIKEAMLAKKHGGPDLDATIFYMDMRTFGKTFQRFRDEAENDYNINFTRGRVHTVYMDKASGRLMVSYPGKNSRREETPFDMVVLSVGQKPCERADSIANTAGLEQNEWGFAKPEPFSLSKTGRQGVLLGGSFSGPKDIADSVISAQSASLGASLVLHASGGGLADASGEKPEYIDVSLQAPSVKVILCQCGQTMSGVMDMEEIAGRLKKDPSVADVVVMDRLCTQEGWEALQKTANTRGYNRILIGACIPYAYTRRIKELGVAVMLDPVLMEVEDIRSAPFAFAEADQAAIQQSVVRILGTGVSRLKQADPLPKQATDVIRSALVAGGGIAGMTAALAIADHGYQVDLVEKQPEPGGNLVWLKNTVEGYDTQQLLDTMRQKLEAHPRVTLHTSSTVISSFGQVGSFYSTIESGLESSGEGPKTIEHGVAIIATGGSEATTSSYCYGDSDAVVTHKELEHKVSDGIIDYATIDTVAMIQCVDSRMEPRNYCSRVCCASTLKHILHMKNKNPDISVYVLYRDIMSYGFAESWFTEARKAGAIFIPYGLEAAPEVSVSDQGDCPVTVKAFEPLLEVGIEIHADLLVLATGIVPEVPESLVNAFGAETDTDGFFLEAESKWRPVDSLKEGVFACGLALSPRSITESVATAEAAAQRSLRILSKGALPRARVTASVRHSLCALCERCIDVCPYGARFVDLDMQKVLVNEAMCQGCGNCATECPNSASVLEGFFDSRMLETIDMMLQ